MELISILSGTAVSIIGIPLLNTSGSAVNLQNPSAFLKNPTSLLNKKFLGILMSTASISI